MIVCFLWLLCFPVVSVYLSVCLILSVSFLFYFESLLCVSRSVLLPCHQWLSSPVSCYFPALFHLHNHLLFPSVLWQFIVFGDAASSLFQRLKLTQAWCSSVGEAGEAQCWFLQPYKQYVYTMTQRVYFHDCYYAKCGDHWSELRSGCREPDVCDGWS